MRLPYHTNNAAHGHLLHLRGNSLESRALIPIAAIVDHPAENPRAWLKRRRPRV
jgi:hypothetical protein